MIIVMTTKQYFPIDSFKRERLLQKVRVRIELETLKGLKAIYELKRITGNEIILRRGP